MNPFKWIGSSIGDVIDAVGGVIDGLHTSDKEKLEAKIALTKLEREFQQKVMEADAKFAEEQAKVITAETKGSWLAANWRPILMLTFTYIIAHNFIFAPMFSIPAVAIPNDMWELLKLGIGGYIVGRTGEKIVEKIKTE